MAALSISPVPHTLSNMSGRRAPLSSNPNAINSPYRGAAPAASKQKRSYATIQREEAYGQPPPAKKQMVEGRYDREITSARRQPGEQRVTIRRANGSQQAFLDRRPAVVREKPQQVTTNADKGSEENQEAVRQWQKHYRKIFPTFVFYFESLSEDTRAKYTKLVTQLGAREVKFFSNEVTHVVTTRSIPVERPSVQEVHATSSTNDSQESQSRTINPLLLDRSSETTVATSEIGVRARFLEPPNRRLQSNVYGGETKRQPARSADVLEKARDLGMKLWSLEKLRRITETMLSGDEGYQVHGHNTRSNSVHGSTIIPRNIRDADLSQLIRNERIHGPSDRDPTVATKELCVFKGPFLYIHDIDEKLKPIMVREYAKITTKGEGDWPQFRSVANGKCPFVEEDNKREIEKEKEMLRLQKQQEKERAMIPRTRAAAATEAARMQPPRPITGKRALAEMEDGSNRTVTVTARQVNPFTTASKDSFSQRMEQETSMRNNQNAFVSRAAAGRLFGGEPVASGLQPSNITSAIHSHMISSTAAQPGAKTGTSKEVHGLQRKVLEKNSGGPGSHGMTSSHRLQDFNTSVREQQGRQLSRRGQDKLELIEEDLDQSECEDNCRKVEVARVAKAVQQRKAEKREAKPGYCENCQEKFDDFDEHILARKHRKFADKAENWKELDDLINKLVRPLRDDGY